jgi:DNA-binding transcriptional ArsR family regulator
VYTRQRADNRFGLRVRAPLENVALFGGGDVFEDEHSAAGLAVAQAAEALRDAVGHPFTHVAAKEQLSLDLRGAILFDDERDRSAQRLGHDTMHSPAEAVIDADAGCADDPSSERPAEPLRREDGVAGRDRHASVSLHLQRCEGFTIVNSMVQYSQHVDHAFAALADPTRRAVLERLGSGRATISELAEPFGMSLTGMGKHIRLLEEAELVTTEKIGRVRRCTLAPYAFEGISTWLQRLDRFAQVVERTKGAPNG